VASGGVALTVTEKIKQQNWAPPGERSAKVLIVLALLVVVLLAAVGFAWHFLWVIAAIFLVIWLIGLGRGRGERAGRHGFFWSGAADEAQLSKPDEPWASGSAC
jgi:hypothetical protein